MVLPREMNSDSLAHQVRDRLLQEIKTGRFSNLDHLPPEAVLAIEFQVSRNTIRTALTSLEEGGLISRKKGVGTRILRQALGLSTFFDVAKEVSDILQDCGFWATRALLTQKRMRNPQVQQLLEVDPREELLRFEKIWRVDGIPLVFGVDYVPVHLILHPCEENGLPGSIFQFLEECCEERIEYVRTEVDAVLGDQKVNELLEIKAGIPLLHMHSLGFNERNKPVFFSGSHFRSGFLKFSFIRRRASP